MLRALRQWLNLPARTRSLIARHPHLLPAFERWHRYHTNNLEQP